MLPDHLALRDMVSRAAGARYGATRNMPTTPVPSASRPARSAFFLIIAMTIAMSIAAALARETMVAAKGADPGWPRIYPTSSGGRVRIYQPQIASWENQRHLVAYVAIGYQARGADKAVLGTVRIEAETTVALAERLVSFAALRITETHFGSIGRDETRVIVREIERAMPEFERVISLDRVLAGLEQSQIRPKNVAGVKADPPAIFFSTKPAVLLGFDGAPIWSPIDGSDLKFAINTNWDLFEHMPSKTLYLRHGSAWLTSSAMSGPWTAAGRLPASFAKLPADENWKEVSASLPGQPLAASDVPAVFVSTSPAELIATRSAPLYIPVPGAGDLAWVSNTDSDVFRMGERGAIYYLVAGRWFSAPDFAGPWTFATLSLPAEFSRIGAEHPRARVLASVPGTRQAAEAVLLAQIPQTAKVSTSGVQAPVVTYQGQPQFHTIDQTTMRRAVNTDKDVIQVGAFYYLCFQGVWFVAGKPAGPWTVAATVPSQIYLIPVSSPAHHVTYVTIVESDAGSVTFATAAGYSGLTIAWGCAMWGTGWYYAPYVWYGPYYPIYYPYIPTYGYSAWYNPATGVYARGAVAYGPYGGAGAAARYNPATGTYARGAAAWGPYGARGAGEAYNPRTGVYARTQQGAGVYGSWGSTSVQRGDDWAHTARATNKITGNTARVTRTDEGAMISGSGPNGGGFVAAGEEGVYAGRDGNVYRRAEDGGWQKYENGGWGETHHPGDNARAGERATAPGEGSTIGQLERDRSARQDGAQRANGQRASGQRGSGERASGQRPSGGGRGARPSGGRSGGRGRG
jgi:hypothetical protein